MSSLRGDSEYAVRQLGDTIEDFRSSIDTQMRKVDDTTNQIQATTNQIYNSVNEFKQKMVKSEEVQLAHENIIRIDQVIKEQFGDYDRIRRTIIGVVRDFDINLVRNKTIQELSEELWLTSSRYWLSYALIAVTSWVNDYPEVAANAITECTHRDKIKSTLFFTLLNLRFGRNEVARRWFSEYLKTLDPTFMQNEAAVMLQAYISGTFGRDKALEAKVNETINEWIAIINEDAAIANDLVNAYAKYIEQMQPSRPFSFEAIRQFCTNADQVEGVYRDMSKFAPIKAMVDSLDVPDIEQREDNYKSRVDAVLTSLITNYDQEEDELKTQQQYYNLIIKNNGDREDAEAQYQEILRLKGEGFNIGRQLIGWVLYSNNEDTDVHVRKFALSHTKGWLVQAMNNFYANIQQRFPTGYKLKIDGWEGMSNGADQAEQEKELREYFNTHKLTMVYLNVPNAVAAVAAVLCMGLSFVSLYFLIGVVLGLGFLGFNVFRALKAFPVRVQSAVEALGRTITQIGMFKRFCADATNTKNLIAEELEYKFIAPGQ
ncbi:hypothetical protein JS530_00735 [Bifidobacterium sp. LC6]|uniref:Uncharacterized protein n=1 Tax=Bifidobacterium colobi TaxID=2809026 RepID=A0ABS5USW7_9BIFI|nr:hypothetical protein [Bifidobacterium colobi]MBT1174057.1 hypothetical protein [Bifidobacterium colobi]